MGGRRRLRGGEVDGRERMGVRLRGGGWVALVICL